MTRHTTSIALAILMLTSAAAHGAAPVSAKALPLEVKWRQGKKQRALKARWVQDQGLVLSSKVSPSQGGQYDDLSQTTLLSVVGPLVSTRVYTFTDSGGVHPSVSDAIRTTSLTSYSFDLETHLRQTKQGGEVAWQWLKQLPERVREPSKCPKSREELRWEDRSLGFWVGYLIGTGCITSSYDMELYGSAPKQFAIMSWDPSSGLVTLAIESSTARVQSTVHELETFRAQVRPPKAWIPWLEQARQGQGLLGDHLRWRVIGLKDPDDIERAHRIWERSMTRQTLFIGKLHEPLQLRVAGYDDRLLGGVCFTPTLILGNPSSSRLDLDAGPCTIFDLISPSELEAKKIKEDTSAKTLQKHFPQWSRRGDLYLIEPGELVERSRPARVVWLPGRAVELIGEVFEIEVSAPKTE